MNKHEKNKRTLKIVGICVLSIGFILAAIGFISFFSSFSTGETPDYFWCAFLGLPMLAFGGMISMLAFKREIAQYVKNESVPVINDASEELSPAVRNVASAMKDGFEGDKIPCPHCGKQLEKDSVFCNACGKRI